MANNTTNLADFIPTEKIEEAANSLNLTTPTYLALADTGDQVGPGLGANVQIGFAETPTVPAGTVPQNAEAPIIDLNDSHVNITPGTVRFGFMLSRELTHDAAISLMRRGVRNVFRAMLNRIDSDGWATIASLTNISGSTTVDLTEAIWLAAKTAFEIQLPDTANGAAYIARPTQYLNWVQNVQTLASAYFGSEPIAAGVQATANLIGQGGFRGSRHGVPLFQSMNVPLNGTNDALTAFFGMQEGSTFQYRAWELINMEEEWIPGRKAWALWFAMRYGVGLLRQSDARQLIADDV